MNRRSMLQRLLGGLAGVAGLRACATPDVAAEPFDDPTTVWGFEPGDRIAVATRNGVFNHGAVLEDGTYTFKVALYTSDGGMLCQTLRK